MPAQTTTANKSLLARLAERGRQAAKAVKDQPVDWGERRLPPGIEGGVAKVVKCYFSEYKEGEDKGKVFFRVEARIVEPKQFAGQTLEGDMIQLMEPLEPRAKPRGKRTTFEHHYKYIRDHLVMLLAKDRNGAVPQFGFDDLEVVAAQVVREAPYVRFRTWAGQKQVIVQKAGKWWCQNEDGTNPIGPYATEAAAREKHKYAGREPLTNTTWEGRCEYNGQAAPGAALNYTDPNAGGGEESSSPEAGGTDAVSFNEFEGDGSAAAAAPEEELDQLATLADGGDEDSGTRLRELAEAAGVSDTDITGAPSWGAVIEMVRVVGSSGDEVERSVEEEESKPAVGDVYGFLRIDPKTKKPVVDPKTKKPAKPVEVEVKEVNEKNQTVAVVDLSTKTKYLGVRWDALLPV